MSTHDIDTLRLHPDAARVPLPGSSDRASLKASLSERGQEDPIEITPDGTILDGRTRWSLLKELGAKTVDVRVWDIPEGQQVGWMVGRAVERRHLTMAQKKQLNDLLRVQVIAVREPSQATKERGKTEPMLIGHSQTERAATLGVGISTVKDWDASGQPEPANQNTPTHAIDARGRPQLLHKEGHPARPVSVRKAPKPKHVAPDWKRRFNHWCKHVLPEDRKYVLEMSEELHKAMALLDIKCREIMA